MNEVGNENELTVERFDENQFFKKEIDDSIRGSYGTIYEDIIGGKNIFTSVELSLIMLDLSLNTNDKIFKYNQSFDYIKFFERFGEILIEEGANFINLQKEATIFECVETAKRMYNMYTMKRSNEVYCLDFANNLTMCPVIKSDHQGNEIIIGMIFEQDDKYLIMPALEEISYVNVFKENALKNYTNLLVDINNSDDVFDHESIKIYERQHNPSIGMFSSTVLNRHFYNRKSYLFMYMIHSIIDTIAFHNAVLSHPEVNNDEDSVRKLIRNKYFYEDMQIMFRGNLNSLPSKEEIEENIEKYKKYILNHMDYTVFPVMRFDDKESAMMYLYNINTSMIRMKKSTKASSFINDILNF